MYNVKANVKNRNDSKQDTSKIDCRVTSRELF